jgi:hypothetical protein
MGTITIAVLRGEPNAVLPRDCKDSSGAGAATVSGGADLDGKSFLPSMQRSTAADQISNFKFQI